MCLLGRIIEVVSCHSFGEHPIMILCDAGGIFPVQNSRRLIHAGEQLSSDIGRCKLVSFYEF